MGGLPAEGTEHDGEDEAATVDGGAARSSETVSSARAAAEAAAAMFEGVAPSAASDERTDVVDDDFTFDEDSVYDEDTAGDSEAGELEGAEDIDLHPLLEDFAGSIQVAPTVMQVLQLVSLRQRQRRDRLTLNEARVAVRRLVELTQKHITDPRLFELLQDLRLALLEAQDLESAEAHDDSSHFGDLGLPLGSVRASDAEGDTVEVSALAALVADLAVLRGEHTALHRDILAHLLVRHLEGGAVAEADVARIICGLAGRANGARRPPTAVLRSLRVIFTTNSVSNDLFSDVAGTGMTPGEAARLTGALSTIAEPSDARRAAHELAGRVLDQLLTPGAFSTSSDAPHGQGVGVSAAEDATGHQVEGRSDDVVTGMEMLDTAQIVDVLSACKSLDAGHPEAAAAAVRVLLSRRRGFLPVRACVAGMRAMVSLGVPDAVAFRTLARSVGDRSLPVPAVVQVLELVREASRAVQRAPKAGSPEGSEKESFGRRQRVYEAGSDFVARQQDKLLASIDDMPSRQAVELLRAITAVLSQAPGGGGTSRGVSLGAQEHFDSGTGGRDADRQRQVLIHLSEHVARARRELTVADVIDTAANMVKAHTRGDAIAGALRSVVLDDPYAIPVEELPRATWALTAAAAVPAHVLAVLAQRATEALAAGLMNDDAAARMGYALALAQYFDEAFLRQVFSEAVVSRWESWPADTSNQMYQTHLSVLSEAPELGIDGVSLPLPVAMALRESLAAASPTRSPLHSEVSKTLMSLFITHVAEYTLPVGYSVDIAIPDKRLAIEVDGDAHYLPFEEAAAAREGHLDAPLPTAAEVAAGPQLAPQLSPSSRMKHRHIRESGWALLSISPRWWRTAGENRPARARTLQRAVEAAVLSPYQPDPGTPTVVPMGAAAEAGALHSE